MKRCRSMLFMPGNNPGMLASAQSLGADCVIFDMEDAVAQTEKDAARILIRHALTYMRPQGVGVAVRINALDTAFWKEDIAAVVRGGADFVLAPKTNGPDYVRELMAGLEAAEAEHGVKDARIVVFALVESALGIENAFAIASAHKRLGGMLLGAEDLTAELGARRSAGGDEIFHARSRILMACRAAGIRAIDTPFPFVTDLEALAADAAFAAQLGFDGKAAISPHHIVTINAAFSPSPEQINWAGRVMAVARRAAGEGKGVASLDGMMIDLPVIKRAERILAMCDGPVEDFHAN
ncbi:MAG: CoA ester lyase [Deltaproteobacteria bacterium]|jgi:citrate lyase subunit beta/citryl-CoA lyase|nr:CoA ester lyase [Deltaproteobacteria bacterium]